MNRTRWISAVAGGLAALALVVILLRHSLPAPAYSSTAEHLRDPSTPPSPVRFDWHFPGATKIIRVRQTGPDHYTLTMPEKANYFIFKLNGAAGRTLKLTFAGVPAQKWNAIRPVYAYADDLSDPALYEPDAKGQSRWQFMTEAHVDDPADITYTHHFDGNDAYVALRVPYTLEYQQRYLAAMPKQKGVEVIEIGKSAEGRPLTLIKISRDDEQAEKQNPCILMYAREHCDEPDGSWAVQGALVFLIGDTVEAKEIRNRFTFLLIPMVDPDGFLAGGHEERVCYTFSHSNPSQDALTYTAWFEHWINAGKRLDLALDLHNPEPQTYSNLLTKFIEFHEGRLEQATQLNTVVRRTIAPEYSNFILPDPIWTTNRLGGWLGYYYCPLPILYEINSQCPKHRLSLDRVRTLGVRLATASTHYLSSDEGRILLADIDHMRYARLARIAEFGPLSGSAIERGYQLRWTKTRTSKNAYAKRGTLPPGVVESSAVGGSPPPVLP